MDVFDIFPALGQQKPILLSIPHSGLHFPDQLSPDIDLEVKKQPSDTDWFVDRLYEFAPSMGITMIRANYSRYVIDLNRSAENKKLYSDNRVQFDLVPQQKFDLTSLYPSGPPTVEDIEKRKELFYWPYYAQVGELLDELKGQFQNVLFFDAHSIKSQVPAVQDETFPDLVLGNLDETTASSQLIKSATDMLRSSELSFSHNFPFKGGNLTRYFSQPEQGVHGLQLEMSQKVYMDENKVEFLPDQAQKIQVTLKSLFTSLNKELQSMNQELKK